MNSLQAIVLGLIQGFTEFLPISSSGHLVLSQALLNIGENGSDACFEIILHLATLLAVVLFFHKKLISLFLSLFDKEMAAERKMIFYLFLGTLPAVVTALLIKDKIDSAFASPQFTSCMLIVTGAILLLPRFFSQPEKQKSEQVGLKQAILMGMGQACALLPGISRSGSTIVSGMLCGVKPAVAAEFSFLLAIPAILGGAVFEFKELSKISSELAIPYLLGAVAAFLSGWLAVSFLLRLIRKGKFEYFAYYCIAVGLAALLFFTLK